MGLWLEAYLRFDDFGIRTTEGVFQLLRKRPRLMEILNSLVRDGAMLSAIHLSILADIRSGPLTLFVSKDLMYESTSLAVQSTCSSSGDAALCMVTGSPS